MKTNDIDIGTDKPTVLSLHRSHSVWYLLILVAGSIFVVELGIMHVLEHVSFLSKDVEAYADALTLILVVFPVLYVFAFRPIIKLQRELSSSNTTFKLMYEMLKEGILVVNPEGIVRYVNPATCALFQRPAEQLIGYPFGYPVSDECNTEITISQPNGEDSIVEMRTIATTWNGEPVMLAALHDITEQKQLLLELEDLATHDGLTGLYNHRIFYSMLEDELRRSQRHDHPLSLLMLDIDHFKQINDTHGHRTGDAILRELSKLLMELVRDIDRVCRYGGEEIMLLLPETPIEDLKEVAERIRTTIERHAFDVGEGNQISITISIGVANYPEHEKNAARLVEAVDTALYTSKDNGRNQVCLASTPSWVESAMDG